MNWRMGSLSCCIGMLVVLAGARQVSESPGAHSVVVPSRVVALLRPILREKQGGDERRLNKLLYTLTQTKGRAADEALVVLMCFDLGESQEETDAVIARGRRMLPLLEKYKNGNPRIPAESYPVSMLKGASTKADAFEGAVKAINHGWRSTADNPEG